MQAKDGIVADRVVVVTGAARGMGAATARSLLQAGARVVALDLSWGKIDEYWTEVDDVRREFESYGDRALVAEADVADDAALDRAFESTLRRFGTVDALINNAALLQHHLYPGTGRMKVLDTSVADWEKMLGVNVIGALKTIRRFIQPMIAKKGGSIVNIASSGAIPQYHRPDSLEQPYMASKAALTNLSVYLASEVKEHNVAVNVVFPGHAEMTGWQLVDISRKQAGLPTPSSRMIPEHIVPLLLFLVSHDVESGPTGRIISTDEWNLLHGHGTAESWRRENVGQTHTQPIRA
jgi:NAD(P)-dependent dehydrogenase (short-subunit alcohol dehydrogenase family)